MNQTKKGRLLRAAPSLDAGADLSARAGFGLAYQDFRTVMP